MLTRDTTSVAAFTEWKVKIPAACTDPITDFWFYFSRPWLKILASHYRVWQKPVLGWSIFFWVAFSREFSILHQDRNPLKRFFSQNVKWLSFHIFQRFNFIAAITLCSSTEIIVLAKWAHPSSLWKDVSLFLLRILNILIKLSDRLWLKGDRTSLLVRYIYPCELLPRQESGLLYLIPHMSRVEFFKFLRSLVFCLWIVLLLIYFVQNISWAFLWNELLQTYHHLLFLRSAVEEPKEIIVYHDFLIVNWFIHDIRKSLHHTL